MKSWSVAIQVKAAEQYRSCSDPLVLFIMLYNVLLTLDLRMKSWSAAVQIKATEQYFAVVLFIMLYKVVLILSLWMKS